MTDESRSTRLARWLGASAFLLGTFLGSAPIEAADETPRPWPGDAWRRHRRIVDLHQHINAQTQHLERATRILERAGVGLAVNLSGGTVTRPGDEPSAFERMKALQDRLAPERFLSFFNLDYSEWNDPAFAEKAVRQVERAHALGAAGLKEFKRLGLGLRDAQGRLLRIDDPKLDGVWRRCGELGLPVSIHVADPKAFWLPYDQRNERWKELRDHPKWWFGDPKEFPSRLELLDALDRVILRHPGTTFVCVHFANNAEDLEWVEAKLDSRPNMWADLAARIPELGRHDPVQVRRLFIKHADRIVFATDFQSYDRLILGSAGDGERPTDDDALEFFRKEWKWLETNDRHWSHMTPTQGDWTINAIGLPVEVLRKIYFDNARRLLARSLPPNRLQASWIEADFEPDARADHPAWAMAPVFDLEQRTQDGAAMPHLATACRVLWSQRYLYLSFDAPYTRLTTYPHTQKSERILSGQALWDRDVVEVFIAPDPSRLDHYTEYEWAPNGESLDLKLGSGRPDFDWNSGMQSSVAVDSVQQVWRCRVRIPLSAMAEQRPQPGTQWRMNLYRIDRAHNAFLASNPTLNSSFHTPTRFGWLQFTRE